MTDAPLRPRLLPHVLPRRHLAEQALVVLYDSEQLDSHRVAERTWVVLAAMDGTRDAPGLVARAKAQGAHVEEAEVRELVADLAAHGMVTEGVPDRPPPATPVPPATARPLRHLPAYRLACDGSGTCCRFYPSIAFGPLDAARARAACPDVLGGGASPDRVFLPLYGSDEGAHSVALVEGRCAYLEVDGRCRIHAALGADEKPLGCRTYPARFVDDGASVRVSPWPECACVLASGAAREISGDLLVDPSRATDADLDPAIHVERLPAEVHVAPGRTAPLAELVAWADALVEVEADDAVASLFSLARALEVHGLDVAASRAALVRPSPPPFDAFSAAIGAVSTRVEALAAETWRSPRDVVRVTATALHGACLLASSLGDELLRGPGTYAAVERFYVRLLVFGHHAVHKKGLRSMSELFFDRAVRALLGRALGVVASTAELDDPAFGQPLALVEATMRGYGLSAYLRDIAPREG